MKLYLVSRTDNIDCWEYVSFVLAAKNEKSALEWTPRGKLKEYDDYEYQWTSKENLKIECIGESNSPIEKVILASYNAG